MMPIVGQLVSRVDPRYLVATGFIATSVALYHMTSINLEIDFRTAAMMRIYQTIGLAFIFIPINTLSYVDMPPNKSNQVSGITNLARNLGGSIGISMLSTFLLRLAQKHQVYLSANTTATNPAFQQRIQGMTQTLTRQGIPPDVATARAYSMVARIVSGQATTLAYIDIISAMALGVICLVPMVFIMKRPRRGMKAAAAH